MIHGPKRIENRTWATNHRGPLAIHAGKKQPDETKVRQQLVLDGIELPEVLPTSCLLGVVDVVDCVPLAAVHSIPFAEGPICWRLSEPRPLSKPIPCRGFQGMWKTVLL